MFGPRMTPSGLAPVRSARAWRHSATMEPERPLAGKVPPTLPIPDR